MATDASISSLEREQQFRCGCGNIRVACCGRTSSSTWPECSERISSKAMFVPLGFVVLVENITIKLECLVQCRHIDPSDGFTRPRQSSLSAQLESDANKSTSATAQLWTVYRCNVCDYDCFAVEDSVEDIPAGLSRPRAVLSAQLKGYSEDLKQDTDYSPAFGIVINRSELPAQPTSATRFRQSEIDAMMMSLMTASVDKERRAMEQRIAEFTQQEVENFNLFERKARGDARFLAKKASRCASSGEEFLRFKRSFTSVNSDRPRASETSRDPREKKSRESVADKSLPCSANGDPDGELLNEVDIFGFGDDLPDSHERDLVLDQLQEEASPQLTSSVDFSSQLGTSLPVRIPRRFRETHPIQTNDDTRDRIAPSGIIPPHTLTEVPFWSTRIPRSVRARDIDFPSSIR